MRFSLEIGSYASQSRYEMTRTTELFFKILFSFVFDFWSNSAWPLFGLEPGGFFHFCMDRYFSHLSVDNSYYV